MTDRLKIPWATGAPVTSPSRRLLLSPVGLALLGGILLVVLFKLLDWTAELLWFRALGYEDVFWRLRFAEIAMFATAFIPVFVYVLLNLLVLARLADLQSLLRGRGPAGMSQSWPNHSRTGVAQPKAHRLTPLLILGSAATAAIFGFVFPEEMTEAPPAPISGPREALSKADQALRRGDWTAFGREWERLKSLLEK